MTRTTLGKLLDVATLLALVVVAGLLVSRRAGSSQGPAPGSQAAGGVHNVGEAAPQLEVVDQNGNTETVSWQLGDSSGTLLLLFNTNCGVCEAQRPAWLSLAADALASGIRVRAATEEDLEDSVVTYLGPAVSVSQILDPSVLWRHWGINGVPATLLIDAAGVVHWAHLGLLSPDAAADLRKRFASLGHKEALLPPDVVSSDEG